MLHKSKKSLGQNFLKSKNVLQKIIQTGEIQPEDIILEIGPGQGVLTEKLLEKAGQVIAVEKDDQLFDFLQEKFSTELKSGKLILTHGDILEFESGALFAKAKSAPKYKIIANIPYNITGAILRKFLIAKIQPSKMVLLVQKEVAQRITGSDSKGKENLLSLSVKAYGVPKIIMKVKSSCFSPAPKVDSALISINNISRDFFSHKDSILGSEERFDLVDLESKFWQIVHAGFAHKRKILTSNLKSTVPNILDILEKAKISPKVRAEDLSLHQWRQIIKIPKG
jgi:16S rRNA (adenine1518-N6/adenine1519-N6)-dimethyltransferase